MQTVRTVGLCVLLVVGCGGEDEPASTAQVARLEEPPEASPEAEAPAEVTPAEASPSAAAPTVEPPPAPTREQLERRRALRQQGRELVRSGNLPAALERFHALVELAPRSPAVLCEAGYVAHRAEHDSARSLLRRGMSAFAAYPRVEGEALQTLARCEYNLGLAQQRSEHLYEAQRSFEDSLRHRDNATVRARLESVRQTIDDLEHTWVAQDVPAMLELLLEEDDDEEDSVCVLDGRVLAQASEGGQVAGFIETSVTSCYMGGGGALYFAQGPPEEVTAIIIDTFEADDEEASATNAGVWSDFAFTRIGDGDGGRWRATYTATYSHRVEESYWPPEGVDDAQCTYRGGSSRVSEHTVVCAGERCAHLRTASRVLDRGSELTCSGGEVPDWALERAGLERADLSNGDAEPARVQHRIELTFEDGRVRLRTVVGEHSAYDAPPDGEMTIEALLAAPHVGHAALRD